MNTRKGVRNVWETRQNYRQFYEDSIYFLGAVSEFSFAQTCHNSFTMKITENKKKFALVSVFFLYFGICAFEYNFSSF